MCVVYGIERYGYTDIQDEKEGFEKTLVERLVEFIKKDKKPSELKSLPEDNEAESSRVGEIRNEGDNEEEMEGDVEMVEMAAKLGVVHMIGESSVVAKKESKLVKKLAIDYGYSFLKRNVRRSDEVFDIPRARLLKVGMTYEL